MSYGWYFSGRSNVEPNANKLMKNIKIFKILWRWPLRNVKIKMHIKAEVLSKKFQDWWRFSKIDGEVCHGKLRSQHTFRRYDEDEFRAKMDQYQLEEEYISHILGRMKLSNLNGADLFQVKEDDCNVIVN